MFNRTRKYNIKAAKKRIRELENTNSFPSNIVNFFTMKGVEIETEIRKEKKIIESHRYERKVLYIPCPLCEGEIWLR